MHRIKRLYRSTYTGENVIKSLTYENATWVQETEFAPNAVTNLQISNKAVVLGNGPSRTELYPQGDLFGLLKNHRGGLLAAGAVQTYGCNAIVRDFVPDFVVCNDEMAAEMVNNGYCDQTIVYGNANMVLSYPGKFYLTPQDPSWDMGAIAAYLACFDGHNKVYLLGFDCHTGETNYHMNVYSGTPGYPDVTEPTTEEFFSQTLQQVLNTYHNVDFVRVVPTENFYMPERWKYQLNLRQITFSNFVKEVDL